MKKLLLFTLALICLMIFEWQNLSAQTQQWAATYNSGNNDYFEKATIDNSGNVYIVGEKYPTGGSQTSIYTAKYNSSGVFQWQRFMTPAYVNVANNRGANAYTSACDNSGNIYVAGSSDSAFSYSKGFIVKYSPNGDSLWDTYTGINDTLNYVEWYKMQIDNSGNIYLAGYRFTPISSNRGFLVAKYNSSGVLQWMKYQVPAAIKATSQIGFSLRMDNSGNIYVAATLGKTTSSSSRDMYLFKLNNAGALQWEQTYNGPADEGDFVSSMALDASGNVYVEGISANIAPMNKEITCLKYNTSGSLQWTFRTGISGNAGEHVAKTVAVGPAGDVYLTGYFYNNFAFDGVLIKLNAANGTESWRKNYLGSTSSSTDYCTDVTVTYSGFIYVTGVLNYTGNNSNAFVIKYNAAGDSLAGGTYNATSFIPKSIIGGPGSTLFMCGDNTADVIVVKYGVTTGIETNSTSVINNFSLSQNYPNPFNPSTKINFNIPKDSKISLYVFDVNGKLVKSLINNTRYSEGNYSVDFKAGELPSGAYFYKLTAEGFSETKKMLLIK
jgi:uncharacterized delta-60 repeat protein